MADFDNYRKNQLKKTNDLLTYGGEEAFKKLLPIIDDFERAVEHNEKTEDVKLDRGVTLIFDDGSTMALNAIDDKNVSRKIETVVVNYNPFVIPVFTNPLPLMSSGHFTLSKAEFRTLVEKPVVRMHIETQVKPVERKTKKFQKNMIKFSKVLK